MNECIVLNGRPCIVYIDKCILFLFYDSDYFSYSHAATVTKLQNAKTVVNYI